MFTPLLDKLAEPPPPKGVSVKEWDRILAKGPTKMPKIAAPKETDEELREKGRERAVTGLAAEAHRERGRRGERFGGMLGSLGGAGLGVALGKNTTSKALSAGLGYLAGGKLGKTVGEEVDIRKNASVPIELIRKLAARELEKRAFEELTSPFPVSSLEGLNLIKMDSVTDPDLFAIAGKTASMNELGLVDADEVLSTYEALGGTYKHAFGERMFDTQQMAGSPAVAGGMTARARTIMPQIQQAPVSVTTTSIGQTPTAQGGASQPPTSQTSTPSAPTG